MTWWPFKRRQKPAEPDERPPVKTQFVRLAEQRPCLGRDKCRLAQNYWSGLPVWQCPACQFETFNEEEAKRFVIGDHNHG